MNGYNKTALITGAAGFIGSHLAEKLLSSDYRVVALDNFDDFYPREIKEKNIAAIKTHPAFVFIEGDIRDKVLLEKLFAEFPVDVTVHLAAKAGVRPSIERSDEYYDVNINGTTAILEAMRKANARNLIFASSSSVYGNSRNVPFSENDFDLKPISPYAATKLSGEALCHVYHHLFGFNVFALRFFTVYGPRQRPDLAIHKFARKILAGEKIPVFGDGSSRRDYTYIDDIIQGVTLAIEKLNGYEIINLGESRTVRLLELIEILENALGKKAELEFLPMQPGDVLQTYADISKAKKLLGYAPQYPIEKGIENFVRWLENNSRG